MDSTADNSASRAFDQDEALRYLERRVREEARAAAAAPSVEATLAHVWLATAYAKRFGESLSAEMSGASWTAEQRVW